MPSEFKKNKEKRKRKNIYIGIAILIIILLGIIYTVLFFLNSIYKGKIVNLEDEKKRLEFSIQEQEKYVDVYNTIKEYQELSKEAIDDELNWDIVLNTFADTIPWNMWFDYINLNYNDESGTCVIRGRATQRVIIAQWLIDIEKTGLFRNAACKYLSGSDGSDKDNIAYEISADIVVSKIKSNKRME